MASHNSAIHKATGSLVTGRSVKSAVCRNDPQTPLPYSQLHRFSGIVPVESWNGQELEADGFVNTAVNSAINQAVGSQNGLARAFWLPVSHSQPTTFFHSTGIVPVETGKQ